MSNEAKKQEILDAFHFRHATKEFDSTKKVSDEDFRFIMETGRLSPSSLGYEAWKFLVIENEDLKRRLKEVSWGAQGQLPTASHFVIILARTDARYDSEYAMNHQKKVKEMPEDVLESVLPRFRAFQEEDARLFESDRSLFDWASKQTYIALGNMMTAAAQIGVDSCPIEGFNYEKTHELLKEQGLLENGQYDISVMVAFGYRLENPQREKTRREFDDVVQWVK